MRELTPKEKRMLTMLQDETNNMFRYYDGDVNKLHPLLCEQLIKRYPQFIQNLTSFTDEQWEMACRNGHRLRKHMKITKEQAMYAIKCYPLNIRDIPDDLPLEELCWYMVKLYPSMIEVSPIITDEMVLYAAPYIDGLLTERFRFLSMETKTLLVMMGVKFMSDDTLYE